MTEHSLGTTGQESQMPGVMRLTVDVRCERKVLMKLAAFVFLSTVACAMSQGESWHSSELKFGDLGDFKLENGAVIRDCRIAYHTSGKLNDDKSNVVLWPTWFTGSSKQLIPLSGSDGYVDPSRYFVIFVDALGNGISSSPSNSSVQPRMEFPVFTIRDMVNSQYRLLTENLGINHIHAVMGISMGGMQTFQWIVSYPEFMDKAVAIVGSPRLTAYDMLLWRAEESAIREDKDWNGGNYITEPSFATVAEIHNMALTTPSYRVRETAANKFEEFVEAVDKDGLGRMDGNDWLRQLQAMMAHNVASPFSDSFEAAAKEVKAKLMVVAAIQDHMVNPTPAMEFAGILHADVVQLKGDADTLRPAATKKKPRPRSGTFWVNDHQQQRSVLTFPLRSLGERYRSRARSPAQVGRSSGAP
jgi:homoserine O-acetyltransferase